MHTAITFKPFTVIRTVMVISCDKQHSEFYIPLLELLCPCEVWAYDVLLMFMSAFLMHTQCYLYTLSKKLKSYAKQHNNTGCQIFLLLVGFMTNVFDQQCFVTFYCSRTSQGKCVNVFVTKLGVTNFILMHNSS